MSARCVCLQAPFFFGREVYPVSMARSRARGIFFLGGKECRNGGKEEIKPRFLSPGISSLVGFRIREKAGAEQD